MAWQIRFETKAEKEFSVLDNLTKIRILKYLKKLETCEDPRAFGKPLTVNLQDTGGIGSVPIGLSRE